MDWRDTGILLSTRKHGETALILEVFSPTQGRHAGVLRGGTSRKLAPHLQPGAQLDLAWRARLEDHIGTFTVEPQRSRAAMALSSRLSLAGMNALLAMVAFCLPDREPHLPLYQRSEAMLDLLGQPDLWPLGYLRWEMALLSDLGFGLDLGTCAVTGAPEGLVYVSPKSGRAVSAKGAGDWADRLLPLPPVMLGEDPEDMSEIARALGTTGWFLENRLAKSLQGKPLPPARGSFIDLLARPPR